MQTIIELGSWGGATLSGGDFWVTHKTMKGRLSSGQDSFGIIGWPEGKSRRLLNGIDRALLEIDLLVRKGG